MPNPIIAITNINESFTVSGTTPLSAIDFPVTNVTDYTHPFREFRTTTTGQSNQIVFTNTSGSTVNVGAVFVDNVNSDEIRCEPPTQVSSVSTVVDGRNNRRRAVFIFSSGVSVANNQTINIEMPTGANIVDGTLVFTCGAVSIWDFAGTYSWPSGGIQGVSWEHTNQVVVSRFEGGAIEPVQIGPMFLTATLPTVDYLHDTNAEGSSEKQVEIIYKILRQGSKPVLFYENNSDVSKAYVMRVDTNRASQVVDKLTDKVSSAGLKLIEAI